MARNDTAIKGIFDFVFSKVIRTKKKNAITVRLPNKAEANRTEKAERSKRAIKGIEKYEYPAGLYKNDSRCKGSTLPVISRPVFRSENAL